MSKRDDFEEMIERVEMYLDMNGDQTGEGETIPGQTITMDQAKTLFDDFLEYVRLCYELPKDEGDDQ